MSLVQKEQASQPDLPVRNSYDDPAAGLSSIAREYSRLLAKPEATPFNLYIYQTTLSIMKNLCEAHIGCKIPQDFTHIDLACGDGTFLHKLQSEFTYPPAKLSGFDISKEMVSIAHEKYPDLDIKIGDLLTDYPEQKGTANVVTCLNGIHYLSSIRKVRKAFQNACHMLKPDGHFIVCTTDEDSTSAWRGMTLVDLQQRINLGRHPLSWTMSDENQNPAFRLKFYPYMNREIYSALERSGFGYVTPLRKYKPQKTLSQFSQEAYDTLSTEPVFVFFYAHKPLA